MTILTTAMSDQRPPAEHPLTMHRTKPRKRSPSPANFCKPCALCETPRDVLVRCRIDSTQDWHFVCTRGCWKKVSGGVADGSAEHPWYQYGGMWKNKHALVSAKKPKGKKGKE